MSAVCLVQRLTGAVVLLYTISCGSAIPAGADAAGGGVREVPGASGLAGSGLAQVAAGMIAVRAADVACPGGADRAGALVAVPASAGPVTSGELLVFAHPVTVAPAVTGRGGAGRRLAA